MILVVDNNSERRKDTISWLRMRGYMSSGVSYSELEFFTKPFMTVYINPTSSEVKRIKNTDDTISVFICDRPSVKLPEWSINFNSLKSPYKTIIEVFDKHFNHFKTDQMEIVGYACLKNNEFAVGGEIIKLTKLEFLIVCFFMAHKDRKFKIYDASSYFNFKSNPEENFLRALARIGAKCKKEDRLPVIVYNAIDARFNPTIVNFVSRKYEPVPRETDDMTDVSVIILNEIY